MDICRAGVQTLAMSSELLIAQLIPMQAGFRRPLADLLMYGRFVAGGGVFDQETVSRHGDRASSLIAVVRFEDGRHYIRDGIHRVAGILLGGRDRLLAAEHRLEVMTYEMFEQPYLPSRFFTPFDPRREVRRADFSAFTSKVDRLLESGIDPIPMIRQNRHEYAVPRSAEHASVESLLKALLASDSAKEYLQNTPLDEISSLRFPDAPRTDARSTP
jgi:hypothetical protein